MIPRRCAPGTARRGAAEMPDGEAQRARLSCPRSLCRSAKRRPTPPPEPQQCPRGIEIHGQCSCEAICLANLAIAPLTYCTIGRARSTGARAWPDQLVFQKNILQCCCGPSTPRLPTNAHPGENVHRLEQQNPAYQSHRSSSRQRRSTLKVRIARAGTIQGDRALGQKVTKCQRCMHKRYARAEAPLCRLASA